MWRVSLGLKIVCIMSSIWQCNLAIKKISKNSSDEPEISKAMSIILLDISFILYFIIIITIYTHSIRELKK